MKRYLVFMDHKAQNIELYIFLHIHQFLLDFTLKYFTFLVVIYFFESKYVHLLTISQIFLLCFIEKKHNIYN